MVDAGLDQIFKRRFSEQFLEDACSDGVGGHSFAHDPVAGDILCIILFDELHHAGQAHHFLRLDFRGCAVTARQHDEQLLKECLRHHDPAGRFLFRFAVHSLEQDGDLIQLSGIERVLAFEVIPVA